MAFAGLADLLGDVLIQVPITVLIPDVTAPRDAEHSNVAVTWRSGSLPRAVTVAARTRWDELLTGASVSEPFQDRTRLPINNHHQPVEMEIWDVETSILVAATPATSTSSGPKWTCTSSSTSPGCLPPPISTISRLPSG